VAPGDGVAAPVIATDGALVVRITALGADTRLGAVADVLVRARAERSPLERLAERLSAVFVPLVIAIAAFVLVRDRAAGASFAAASLRALAVLVVACPCALAIATPLAITTAMGRLAERGILVRSGEALGGLPRVRVVAFDKTGTLTEGRPRVSAIEALGRGDEARALACAAAVEASSEHGLARAIGRAASERALAALPATDVRVTPGLGVEGRVEGIVVRVGRGSFVVPQGGGAAAIAGRATEALVSLDGRLALRLTFDDRVRASAPAAVRALTAEGIVSHVISGDGLEPTRGVARALDIPDERAHGGCLPAAKVEEVRRLRAAARGPVAFVGDGLNDAPALAAADLSVAVGSGTDLARETADVSLLGDDLGRLAGLFRAARRTRRAVRWNLFWAFAYNVVGVGFAAIGRLPPIFAALAMVVSSLFVVGNSVRLRSALGRDLAGASPGGGGPVGSPP
jgi:Cu+-exporting ATPase